MAGNQRRRVTYHQQEILFDFLNEHRDVATGYNKSAQARQHSREMWARAANLLNSVGDGAVKTGSEWSKYWVDLKAKVKRKNRIIRDASSKTGGGPPTVEELSGVELKFLSILGADYGSGLPMVQVNPFADDSHLAGPSGNRDIDEPMLEEWLDMTSSEERSENFISQELSLPQHLSIPTARVPSPEPSSRCTPVSHVHVAQAASEATANTQPRAGEAATTPQSRAGEAAATPQSRAGEAAATPQSRAGEDAATRQPRTAEAAATPQPRRRRRKHMTAADARTQLVQAARQRVATEAANSAMLQETLSLFRELVSLLRTRYASEDPRGEPQDPAL